MGNAIRVGKIFDIEIRLDFSWFLIFALVTWSLTVYFSAQLPEWSLAACAALAGATSFFFFASVLTHELAHSLISKAQGIPVPRITLFVFGGAAQISEEPRRARDELWMALAGPLTSLALAAGFEISWFVTRGTNPGLSQMLQWLANVNALLGIFNLLPGFPLDGGRVLRAILWALMKNLRRATEIAVYCGVGFAWLLMLFGFFQMFVTNWTNGIWFILIGWFLQNAARQEGEATRVNEALRGHTTREALVTNYPSLTQEMRLDEVMESIVIPTGRTSFPVMEQNNWVGLLTTSRALKIPREKWAATRVAEAMLPRAQLVTTTPDEELTRVLDKMTRARQDELPVVDATSGKFLGFVTHDNIWILFSAAR
jgi:Zn-dependent protease